MIFNINEINKLLAKSLEKDTVNINSITISGVKHNLWGYPVTFEVQE